MWIKKKIQKQNITIIFPFLINKIKNIIIKFKEFENIWFDIDYEVTGTVTVTGSGTGTKTGTISWRKTHFHIPLVFIEFKFVLGAFFNTCFGFIYYFGLGFKYIFYKYSHFVLDI